MQHLIRNICSQILFYTHKSSHRRVKLLRDRTKVQTFDIIIRFTSQFPSNHATEKMGYLIKAICPLVKLCMSLWRRAGKPLSIVISRETNFRTGILMIERNYNYFCGVCVFCHYSREQIIHRDGWQVASSGPCHLICE